MVEYLDDEFFSSTLHYNFLRKQDGEKKRKKKRKRQRLDAISVRI
jgi:hypothetical protein